VSFVYLIFAVYYINLANNRRLILDLYACVNVCIWLAYTYQISFKSNHLCAVMTLYRFYKMAAMASQILFQLPV